MHRRRSQLAANSSAPPTHTPSTAATAGTGEASTTRVIRWKPSIVAAHAGRVGLDRGLEVVARGEVLAGAAQHDAAHRRRRVAASSTASAIAVMVSRSQAFRRSWRSQLTTRAAPRSAVVTVILRSPF